MRTLKELAQEALDIQTACNLCGLAQSFARMMKELGEHVKGTDALNTHAITRLWVDKMAHLSGVQLGFDTMYNAYADCSQLAKS